MTLAIAYEAPRARSGLSTRGVRKLGHGIVWLTVFSIAFVRGEPAPYDLLAAATVALFFLCGTTLPRPLLPMILCMLGLTAGAFLALTQAPSYDPMFFTLVTAFLAVTTIFFAAFVAADPAARLKLVLNAYTAAALVASLAAMAGYFGHLPELTRYGRATGTFQDPNVLGAFLILPAAYTLTLTLNSRPRRALGAACLFALFSFTTLITFSRGAWIGLFGAALLVGYFCFVTGASHLERTRLVLMGLGASALAVASIAVALSLDGVREIFEMRTGLQDYDLGQGGRFLGQSLGLEMALTAPLGLGPMQFAEIYGADPHNVYLNAFLGYGWLGGLSYLLLVALTIGRALRAALCRRSLRLYSIPIAAAFIIIAAEAIIIDTDHWRHFYLLAGLVWGIDAARVNEAFRIPLRSMPARA